MLVTFVVVAFNHEDFIREAVRGALAQTYEPLEVIIADDCSSDRTFDIIQDETQKYSGPHQVVLLQSDRNSGLAANLNKAFDRAAGTIVIVQGGDDISLPARAAKVAAAFKDPVPVDMVCSRVILIDAEGHTLATQRTDPPVAPNSLDGAVELGSVGALGCACAYSRSIWAKYGPLDARILQEDVVLPFRALLENGIRILEEPLVKYRIHGNNLYATAVTSFSREKKWRWAKSWVAIMEDWNRSWLTSDRDDPSMLAKLRYHLKQRTYEEACYQASRAGAIMVAIRAFQDGLKPRHVAGILKRHFIRMNAVGRGW